MYPERADRFVAGGFGENFVTAHMNERNVCIGDIVAVGKEAQLQVSLPRQPCFKLNHRFSLKNFAPLTWKTSRTGWYYRVIQEGTVNVGDEIRLLERRWPEWTVERVQEYLHRDTENMEMNEKLAAIECLGKESRGQFQKRVARVLRRKRREQSQEQSEWRNFRLVSRKMETPRIVSLVLEAEQPPSLEGTENFKAGVHARLKLPNGLIRTYSVVWGEKAGRGFSVTKRIELGIALEPNSRGGSRYLHQEIQVGDTIQVGRITTDVAIASAASNHVFVAGGIGITAFIAMMKTYTAMNWSWELHYAVRSAEDVPFWAQHLAPQKHRITIYDKTKLEGGGRMDIRRIVKEMPWNSHLYFCGPDRMMEAAKQVVQDCAIPDDEVHYEAFAADVSGDPFDAQITNRGGKIISVAEDESLLEALRRELADDIPSSCEVGNCGTCKLAVKDGRVHHRGTALTAEEKTTSMLSCVSRGIGRITIEI